MPLKALRPGQSDRDLRRRSTFDFFRHNEELPRADPTKNASASNFLSPDRALLVRPKTSSNDGISSSSELGTSSEDQRPNTPPHAEVQACVGFSAVNKGTRQRTNRETALHNPLTLPACISSVNRNDSTSDKQHGATIEAKTAFPTLPSEQVVVRVGGFFSFTTSQIRR
ncbi:hypothetical protein LTR39_004616 [Cryomyces antarcticus]|nr:hypothetical protein LTR39_004616 [Cryomyces antarcticus]